MFAIAAAVVWLITAPFIGVFDDPNDGLFVGLALFAAHFGLGGVLPWPRR